MFLYELRFKPTPFIILLCANRLFLSYAFSLIGCN